MFGYIYKTTNRVNGKIYIGQHRASTFESYLGSGKKLWNAIYKYGIDNFMVEMLCKCESNDELDEKEKYYIKLFDACNVNVGYNIAEGGRNRMTGEHLSKEHRQKISQTLKGHKVSDETREKMSAAKRGHKLSEEHARKLHEGARCKAGLKLRGKPIPEERKQRISASMKKYKENLRRLKQNDKTN